MNYLQLKLSGMHCRSCELLIEERLTSEYPESKVEADSKTGLIKIYYTDIPPNKEKVHQILLELGFFISAEVLPAKKSMIGSIKELGIAFVLLLVFFIGYRLIFGNGDLFNHTSANSNWVWSSLISGIAAGLSSCIALVGGLVLAVSSKYNQSNVEKGVFKKFIPHLYFNLGRILGFFILGGLLGLVGSWLTMNLSITATLTIIAGLIMLVLGIKLLNIFPERFLPMFVLPKKIASWINLNSYLEGTLSPHLIMFLGLLTFFLPCGFTQMVQLSAISTGSFWQGGAIMSLFALGTLPGLLGLGLLSSLSFGKLSGVVIKWIGMIVIVFSILNISNGMNLLGVPVSMISKGTDSSHGLVMESSKSLDTQVLNATFSNEMDIYPQTFKVRVNIPVKFVIFAKEDGVGCMSSILIPRLFDRPKFLSKGEVILEFTPKERGDYPITCAMGMQRGVLTVE